MKFPFRLERLLQLRVSAERQQARVLRDAVEYEERERLERDACAARRSDAERQKAELAPTTPRAGILMNLQRAVDASAERTETAEMAYQEALVRVQTARGHYRHARQQRRVLERLRERRSAEWTYEASRHEQAADDEIAARRSPPPVGGNS